MKQLISDNNYPVRRVCGDAQPLRGFLVSEPLLDQAAAPPAVVKSMREDRQSVIATLRRPWRKRPAYPS